MAVPPPVRKLRPPMNTATGAYTRTVSDTSSADVDVCALDPGGNPCRAVLVLGAGNMVVEHPGDYGLTGTQQQVTWTGLAAGTYVPVALSKIESTGSTATNVILIW